VTFPDLLVLANDRWAPADEWQIPVGSSINVRAAISFLESTFYHLRSDPDRDFMFHIQINAA